MEVSSLCGLLGFEPTTFALLSQGSTCEAAETAPVGDEIGSGLLLMGTEADQVAVASCTQGKRMELITRGSESYLPIFSEVLWAQIDKN